MTSPPKGWNSVRLSEVADIGFSSVDKHRREGERPVRLCNYVDVLRNPCIHGKLALSAGSASEGEVARFSLKKHDIILTKDSETAEDIALVARVVEELRQVVLGYHLALIRPRSNRIHPEFLYWALQSSRLRRHFARLAVGVVRSALSLRVVQDARIWIPSLEHQVAASSTLAELEAASATVADLLSAKRRFKRGLAQQLLTGKRRFNEFTAAPWVERRLGDVTKESSFRNSDGLPLTRVMAVRKDAGIVPMKEGMASADLQRYKVVEPRWFAYNPMRLNIGSIAMWPGPEKVLVSPDYVVFATVEEQLRSEYLKHFVHTTAWSNHLKWAGSGGVRVRIWYDDLARMRLRLPPPGEQAVIADLLTTLDKEIQFLRQLHGALDLQRRGVAELLLTGKVRIPA